jgi:endonuclease G, mitochondrial
MKKFLLMCLMVVSAYAFEVSAFIAAQKCDQVIDKQAFKICYDYDLVAAKFVWYKLSGANVNGVNIDERPKFYTEKNLAGKPRAKYADYTKSGYDRGHLAPDASFDYDESVLVKTYSMANIVPMAPTVNRKMWTDVEKLERKMAMAHGSINVLNGVYYGEKPERIGKAGVAVPVQFWKMLWTDSGLVKECYLYKNGFNETDVMDYMASHKIDCVKLGLK